MTNLKEKKNIIFDLGNVVLDIDLNITINRFKDMGFKTDGNFLSKYKQSGVFCDLEEGRISGDEFALALKEEMNDDVTTSQIIEAWNALLLDYDTERIETIIKLRESHKLYILSNTNIFHIEACAYNVPIVGSLDKLFDKAYYSYEMGLSKPHKEIFEALLNDAGIKASETLYLDDSKANIEAAEALGIESWWITDSKAWAPKIMSLLAE